MVESLAHHSPRRNQACGRALRWGGRAPGRGRRASRAATVPNFGRTEAKPIFRHLSTTSSITAVTTRIRSSISHGKSCPSRVAIGQQ